METTQAEEKKEKQILKNEDSLRDFWDNIKHTNICIIRVPEGEDREKGTENILEDIIAEDFPNLGEETDIQVQEEQRVPNRINPKRITLRHVIKMAKIKDKERILKTAREKQEVTYKGTPIRLSADFSAETLHARREWHDIFKVMNGKNVNTLPHKALIQIWRRDQKFYRQAKVKSVQHYETSFTRNVKGTSLSRKEKATTRNIKIMKGKISLVKANIQ